MHIGLTLARNARRIPEKKAIIYGEKEYTYAQFNQEVNKLANGLLNKGIQKGDKVALMMKNSDLFMIVFYAILKAGAVAVPINFRLTAREAAYILQDSDSVCVFFDGTYRELIQEAGKDNHQLKYMVCVDQTPLPEQMSLSDMISENSSEPDITVDERDDAEILYTSGTTGYPKGALFDHHRIIHVALSTAIILKLGPEDRLLHVAPMFHSAELNLFTVTGTYLGCTQIVHQQFQPMDVLRDIEKYHISFFFGIPTMYNFLLQVPNAEEYNLSSVKRCAYGAAPMPIALLEKSMAFFGTDQFYNLCGLTEGGPGGVYLLPEEHKTKIGAGGKSMLNTEVRVVDEMNKDVYPGQVGEMILKSEMMMKRYYNKPEETAKTIKDGWLYTGDLAIIDEDGYITLVDRKKDMIISGGENIYSTEVEHVLYRHPQILEAAVVGAPDEVWGERVVAIIVPKEGGKLDHEEIKTFCRKHLAGYKIPSEIIEEKKIPRNASGKVLKYKIRQAIRSGHPISSI
ncbi:class I adenylate-forming enzyme family protein [Fervidibacillus halotolerans]|uniref:Long-chain-fatty-acid--CoA ligase n=1 Tax=Fervidibacillus halotolerans TaxID=2980027 RepID=A0A9E8LZX8_9BACI|nr:long-chain-fatty-acid--CoA ligase [Fervidibacillus halotolerans]WAA12071.1 long-chain-fatty-acid--CoA ligase [Fervidibacillus halotolerans]